MNCFSEKTLQSLSVKKEEKYYVYGLIDPRDEKKTFFYIGKGEGNRVFNHEEESDANPESEKKKIERIRAIKDDGFEVEKVILCSNLTENQAFAAEASLINAFRYLDEKRLTNIASGHHSERAYSVEDFEHSFGAEELTEEDINHTILVIKINKLYEQHMSDEDLYDTVRGIWVVSKKKVEQEVEYVFGVYHSLIVAVFKPSKWFSFGEAPNGFQREDVKNEENTGKRLYFIDDDFINKTGAYDDIIEQYRWKSIAKLGMNQSAQNPITYLYPSKK